jgi:hypothetical protein
VSAFKQGPVVLLDHPHRGPHQAGQLEQVTPPARAFEAKVERRS